MEIRQWLAAAIERLVASESAKRDAEILLSHIIGKPRSWIIAFDDALLTVDQQMQLNDLLGRREQGEPIAHILGEREFWSLPLFVTPDTLIPRPDTELLVVQALQYLPQENASVLDLGTGTGAVALALASERRDCHITGVDRITSAVELAQRNADKLAITNVTFLVSDWFSALKIQLFDAIVSNPPYIDGEDWHLEHGDVRFEPRSALVADEQGLADLRKITFSAREYIKPGGWLLLEHGWQQAEAVQTMMHTAGFTGVTTIKDYGGNDRVTCGQKRDLSGAIR